MVRPRHHHRRIHRIHRTHHAHRRRDRRGRRIKKKLVMSRWRKHPRRRKKKKIKVKHWYDKFSKLHQYFKKHGSYPCVIKCLL